MKISGFFAFAFLQKLEDPADASADPNIVVGTEILTVGSISAVVVHSPADADKSAQMSILVYEI